MKKAKVLLVLLCIYMLFTSIVGNADVSDLDNSFNSGGYLSEEEVFEAIAVTYKDSNLLELVNSQKFQIPTGLEMKGFNAEEYSEYTNDEYGGMYLNENGELVICYTNDGNTLNRMKANIQQYSNTLLNKSKKILVNSIKLKSVKYSYTDLQNFYNLLNKNFDQYKGVTEFWIDVENNRIVVAVLVGDEGEKSKKDILSLITEDVVSFIESDFDNTYKFTATINGASLIDNGYSFSTPAGRMWSPTKGYYGVITCAHGYSNGDSIYFDSTKIGNITALYFNSTNDSSFIKLDSGHSYTGSKVDEMDSTVPVVNSYITLRGSISGSKNAKVLSTNFSATADGIKCTNMIQADKPMVFGDSGGGAIGGVVDGGRTNLIVAINRASSDTNTLLVKGSYICNAYR